MTASFRSRLLAGEVMIGASVTLNSLETAEALAHSGLDWLFIDLEHSPLGIPQAQNILQAVGSHAAGVLRLPLNDEIWIKKALDTGCAGIIIPQVNSKAEAERAVRWSKYPPVGSRSLGLARAHGYGLNAAEYIQHANEACAVIVQIEHIRAVENVEEIINVAGIDGVFVGPWDLSASLGKPGQVEDPAVLAAIERVRAACQQRGMPLSVFANGVESARRYLAQGFTLIANGMDIWLMAEAAQNMVRGIRQK